MSKQQRHFLSPYKLSLKNCETGDVECPFRFADGEHSIIDLVEDFIKQLSQGQTVDDLRVNAKIVNKDVYSLRGNFETGSYGVEKDIFDVDKNESVFRKLKNHAEMETFYFMVYAHPKDKFAFLIFQKIGGMGIRTVFMEAFREFLKRKCTGYSVGITGAVLPSIARQWIGGNVKKVRLLKMNVPSDLASAANGDTESSFVDLELCIKPKKSRFLNVWSRITSFLDGSQGLQQAFTFPETEGFEFNSVKLETRRGGDSRDFDISKALERHTRPEITRKIKTDGKGRVIFETVDGAAVEVLEELISVCRIRTTDVE